MTTRTAVRERGKKRAATEATTYKSLRQRNGADTFCAHCLSVLSNLMSEFRYQAPMSDEGMFVLWRKPAHYIAQLRLSLKIITALRNR